MIFSANISVPLELFLSVLRIILSLSHQNKINRTGKNGKERKHFLPKYSKSIIFHLKTKQKKYPKTGSLVRVSSPKTGKKVEKSSTEINSIGPKTNFCKTRERRRLRWFLFFIFLFAERGSIAIHHKDWHASIRRKGRVRRKLRSCLVNNFHWA